MSIKLNSIPNSKGGLKNRTRAGRGISSGLGKTCGRGHKGYKARSGSGIKIGFEGGQMPIQRRLPKFGFTSQKSLVSQKVPVSNLLNKGVADNLTIEKLKAVNIIKHSVKYVKIYNNLKEGKESIKLESKDENIKVSKSLK